jgi:hypothetical protein
MRNTSAVLSEFEKIANIWLDALNGYTEQQFALKPDAHSWSIGQVYYHLVKGTRAFHLQQIARCCEGKDVETGKGKSIPGKLTYLLGSFPPMKITVPPSESYTPKQPDSRESIRAELTALMATMREDEQKVAAAPEDQKTNHRGFGYLNAHEWYQLVEMHFRHHLRQKARIDAFLKTAG